MQELGTTHSASHDWPNAFMQQHKVRFEPMGNGMLHARLFAYCFR